MKTAMPLITGLISAGVFIFLSWHALDEPSAYKGRVGPRGEVGGGWIVLVTGVIAFFCFREAWTAYRQRSNGQSERAKPQRPRPKKRS